MSEEPPDRMRTLAFVLRAIGCLDLCALFAVVMPHHWMDQATRFFGMEPLPVHPVVGYLARSTSVLYALHGAILFLLSLDVVRHWNVIRFLGWAGLVHSALLVGIDKAEGLPWWWRYGEGPCFAATGAIILWLQRRARQAPASDRPARQIAAKRNFPAGG